MYRRRGSRERPFLRSANVIFTFVLDAGNCQRYIGESSVGWRDVPISNLGMMGVDSFDAIINQPEAAILAVGRLRTVPEWNDGEWAPRRIITATLSVDHRVADGADGARFLKDLQAALTDWETLL